MYPCESCQIAIDDRLFHEVEVKSHDTLKDFHLTDNCVILKDDTTILKCDTTIHTLNSKVITI